MKIVRGVRGALLLVLAHFFEHGRWASPVQIGADLMLSNFERMN